LYYIKKQGTREKGTRKYRYVSSNSKFESISMSQELEIRFYKFAERCRGFCRNVKWDIINVVYIKQLVRSSSSVSANYIEVSDDLGKADEK
jgi:hypothetical protein